MRNSRKTLILCLKQASKTKLVLLTFPLLQWCRVVLYQHTIFVFICFDFVKWFWQRIPRQLSLHHIATIL